MSPLRVARNLSVVGVVAAVISCVPEPEPVPVGRLAFEQADRAVAVPKWQRATLGESEFAEVLAGEFAHTFSAMARVKLAKGSKGEPFSTGKLLTLCRTSNDAVCFLVHMPGLNSVGLKDRTDLLGVAWVCAQATVAARDLATGRRLGVGLRATNAYSGVAVGSADGEATSQAGSGVKVSPLYPLFAGPTRDFGQTNDRLGSDPHGTLVEAGPTITSVSPSRIKGPWAGAAWRRPRAECTPQTLDTVEPAARWESRRWQESCGAGTETEPPQITISGTGFAALPWRNSVFISGVGSQIESGGESELVVRLSEGIRPGPASVVVRVTPVEADDPAAADRAQAAEGLTVIGPPAVVKVLEGDGQTGDVQTTLQPLVFRLVDAVGTGVPAERVWIWASWKPAGAVGSNRTRVEIITDQIGLARFTLTLPNEPAAVRVVAEAVNVREKASSPFAEATATTLADPAEVARLAATVRRGTLREQRAAAERLGALGPSASAAVDALVAAGKSADRELKHRAVEALVSIGRPEAVALYIAALEGADASDATWGADGLRTMKPKAEGAVPALVRALRAGRASRDVALRSAVVGALLSMDREAAAAVPALVEALQDSYTMIRVDAAKALGRIGRPAASSAEGALRKAAQEDAASLVRDAASQALEKLGEPVPANRLVSTGPTELRIRVGSTVELTVRLTDGRGAPMASERVFFGVVTGRAQVPASAITGSDGIATITAYLGSQASEVTVEAARDAATVSFRITSYR